MRVCEPTFHRAFCVSPSVSVSASSVSQSLSLSLSLCLCRSRYLRICVYRCLRLFVSVSHGSPPPLLCVSHLRDCLRSILFWGTYRLQTPLWSETMRYHTATTATYLACLLTPLSYSSSSVETGESQSQSQSQCPGSSYYLLLWMWLHSEIGGGGGRVGSWRDSAGGRGPFFLPEPRI